jgi:hypothetical protein
MLNKFIQSSVPIWQLENAIALFIDISTSILKTVIRVFPLRFSCLFCLLADSADRIDHCSFSLISPSSSSSIVVVVVVVVVLLLVVRPPLSRRAAAETLVRLDRSPPTCLHQSCDPSQQNVAEEWKKFAQTVKLPMFPFISLHGNPARSTASKSAAAKIHHSHRRRLHHSGGSFIFDSSANQPDDGGRVHLLSWPQTDKDRSTWQTVGKIQSSISLSLSLSLFISLSLSLSHSLYLSLFLSLSLSLCLMAAWLQRCMWRSYRLARVINVFVFVSYNNGTWRRRRRRRRRLLA